MVDLFPSAVERAHEQFKSFLDALRATRLPSGHPENSKCVGEGRLKRRRKRPHRVHLGERGIYIFESRHSPDFRMELVAQDFQHLYVVREGRGFIETESERLPIRDVL